MANLQKQIHIDSFRVLEDKIDAYAIVDEIDVDFSINKADFEDWCDTHDLSEGYEWYQIYADWQTLERLLKLYIMDLYDQEAMDIETPVAKILKTA